MPSLGGMEVCPGEAKYGAQTRCVQAQPNVTTTVAADGSSRVSPRSQRWSRRESNPRPLALSPFSGALGLPADFLSVVTSETVAAHRCLSPHLVEDRRYG